MPRMFDLEGFHCIAIEVYKELTFKFYTVSRSLAGVSLFVCSFVYVFVAVIVIFSGNRTNQIEHKRLHKLN